MKIIWTKKAQNQLLSIEEFIAKDNLKVAAKFTDELLTLAETLIEFPEKGRIVPELSQKNIRELLHKNYRIVYLINRNSIEIVTIFEGHKLFRIYGKQ